MMHEGLIQGYSKTTDRAKKESEDCAGQRDGVPKRNGPRHILVRMPYTYGKVQGMHRMLSVEPHPKTTRTTSTM